MNDCPICGRAEPCTIHEPLEYMVAEQRATINSLTEALKPFAELAEATAVLRTALETAGPGMMDAIERSPVWEIDGHTITLDDIQRAETAIKAARS